MRNPTNPTSNLKKIFIISSFAFLGILSGCDYIGLSNTTDLEEKLAQEGAAAGAGCRLEGLSLIACYDKYPKMRRAHILKGWRDMDEYMRVNKIPTPPPPTENAASQTTDGASVPEQSTTDTPSPAQKPDGPVGQSGSKLPI